MKLTYICGFAWEPKGTVCSRAFPLAEEMVRRGHDVTLIIVPYDNRAHSGVESTRNGVRVVNLVIRKGTSSLARISFDLLKKIDESDPDLVHVFKPKGFAGLAATWLWLRNQKFVLDCDDWEGWGGWNESSTYPWPVKEFIDLQETFLLRRSPAISVASQVLFDRAKSLRPNRERVFYVANGPSAEQVELSSKLLREDREFYRKKLGLSGARVVLYAGHFDPADDVLFFCRAIAQVANRKQMQIAFVGEGPELPNVRSFFAARREVNVHFCGALPYESYAEILAGSDVCAFPYPDTPVYRAKCSARIIDYMLYAKPVVTTAVGQNREYIENGVSGILTPPGDETSFANALDRAIEDHQLRSRLGNNARTRILRHFLWSGTAGDAFELAYHSLLPQKQIETVASLAS